MAAAKWFLLQADASVFDAGDNAVRAQAHKGDDGRPPTFDLGFQTLAPGAKFIVRKFIRASCGARDHVGDAESEVEKQCTFEGREQSRSETAAVKRGPEAIPGPTKMAADRGGVQPRIDAGEEHDQVFGKTKGSMSSMELRKIEESKIECARKFFKKITSDQVKYDVVNSYGKLMELVK